MTLTRNIMKQVFLSILTLLLLAACHPVEKTDFDISIIQNPNSAQGYDSTAAMPHIEFDCNQHDFGRLTEGESISYSFHFRNTGSADLVIANCEATCGCTVADYPRNPVVPGGEGYVTVTFSSSGKNGQQVQDVTVVSNSQPARTKLRILAQVAH